MKKFLVIVTALLLGLGAQATLAQTEKKVITFASYPNWPPLEFLDSSGQIVGYSVDFFTAVCLEAGFEAKFTDVAWEDLFTGLDAGKFDVVMASVTITPERRQKMDFTIPYYIVRQCLVMPAASDLTNLRHFKGLKIGTQYDTTATGIADKIVGENSKTFESIENALTAMLNGEVDAVICEDVVASSMLTSEAFKGKIKISTVIDTPGAEELYGAAVRKNNLDLLIALNEGIKAVKAKGLEAELRRKWSINQ